MKATQRLIFFTVFFTRGYFREKKNLTYVKINSHLVEQILKANDRERIKKKKRK